MRSQLSTDQKARVPDALPSKAAQMDKATPAAPRPTAPRAGLRLGEPRPSRPAPSLVGGITDLRDPLRPGAAWADFSKPAETTEPDLSRLSHRLTGRHQTRADSLDVEWTLTCAYGFLRTARTSAIDLRIR
jgi:hypothetical protein